MNRIVKAKILQLILQIEIMNKKPTMVFHFKLKKYHRNVHPSYINESALESELSPPTS